LPYQTDERLKGYLDTNQLHREQMCRAILSVDKRFTDVHPRHPRGGRDGGRDIESIFRDEQIAFGAVGFVNQANDSEEQKKTIKAKFEDDLKSAISADRKPTVFIFFTNVNLTIGEKEALKVVANNNGMTYCDIMDRERLRIILDSPDGFSIRFQYLNISLSEEEQASFFAKWGDDIQSVISTGFQKIESTLNRILFLQESTDVMSHLSISFELDKKYLAEEIGHFRCFCSMYLKEPKYKILSLLFGASDLSMRMRKDSSVDFTPQLPGIKYGIGRGQWEIHLRDSENEIGQKTIDGKDDEKFVCVGTGSSGGLNEVEFLTISYNNDGLVRYLPSLSLRDIDEAMFLPFLNKSLAEKIKAIHIFSNGYKLQEIYKLDFYIDSKEFDPNIPANFSEAELNDPCVRLRPNDSSTFYMKFFEETPKKLFVPNQVINSLEKRNSKA
jgi:hypothetical protein